MTTALLEKITPARLADQADHAAEAQGATATEHNRATVSAPSAAFASTEARQADQPERKASKAGLIDTFGAFIAASVFTQMRG
ncbi:hypothetical protein [Corynebacterium liangguodongii]|uniref:Uncharacterized protein n=1 Tax=Corynebacterium liangguodongii TaxID=2079535 RepID=A0A2S0WGD4_9CORY|nr:hypothetical protein [Corynebacterium liangguodongii]AWB84829.1 hypothetical protein C3E79_10385 [Corynebacterium liangguodongii]PWB99186.1 hypothetical protein DF219_08000 [Corynebacterium liangguodongii]